MPKRRRGSASAELGGDLYTIGGDYLFHYTYPLYDRNSETILYSTFENGQIRSSSHPFDGFFVYTELNKPIIINSSSLFIQVFLLKFSFSEKATKICVIFLTVLTFT